MRVKGVGSVAGIYAPIGFQYINEFGLSIGAEAAVCLAFSQIYVWGALRMGWYFY